MAMVTPGSDTTIDAGAEKRFFIEMLTKDIELLPAVVDLVDNSVDGARGLTQDGDLTGHWVKIDITTESFTISDNSGGMTVDIARHYAFRFGRSKDFVGTKRSVGQFGVGMKRAIFKIGNVFSVKSIHRDAGGSTGSRFLVDVNVEQWAVQADWTFEFSELEEEIKLRKDEVAGTTIHISSLHPSVEEDFADEAVLQHLRTELRVRHQESIQRGLNIFLNGDQPLKASRPSLQSSEVLRPIYKEFQIPTDSGSVDVELFAGTVAPAKRNGSAELDDGQAENFQDPSDAGWYLFCNDRLLLAADRSRVTGWGNPAAAYHPQYRNFRGFVYLSADDASLLPWNTTKTAVDRDSPVFRAVQSEMKTALVEVQAVINRAKSVRQRLEEDEELPEFLTVLDTTADQPLTELSESKKMITPPAPPPKPTPPTKPQGQRIQYVVDPDRFEAVATALEATSGSEVGRLTFDYFYSQEID